MDPWGNFGGLMSNRFVVLKRTALIYIPMFLGLSFMAKDVYAVADFGNAGVLPVGRHQVTFRFGDVSGIQDKFNNAGTLQTPSRMNLRFDNAFLMKQAEFQKLAKILDEQLLPNQKPSQNIDLGYLTFAGNAHVSYFAPQIARGMTSNWSLGIAIPMVRYQSDIRAENGGVNTSSKILDGVASAAVIGNLNGELGNASERFIKGPKHLFKTQSEKDGYKPLSQRDEQFIGDIVLGSSLKLYNTRFFDFYLLNQLTLPTGPKDDPDDLVDLNIFGKTNFQTLLFTNYNIVRWAELGMGAGYTWGIKDDIVKRVPRNADDDLPPESTKETVDLDPGDAVNIQFASNFILSDYFHIGLGYELNYKSSDKYTGSKNSRYDLLEKDTNSESQVAKFKLSYTTLNGFLQGNDKIPYSLVYAFADTVRGKNIEREMTHELLMKFYF
jgi:hypothetical protein